MTNTFRPGEDDLVLTLAPTVDDTLGWPWIGYVYVVSDFHADEWQFEVEVDLRAAPGVDGQAVIDQASERLMALFRDGDRDGWIEDETEGGMYAYLVAETTEFEASNARRDVPGRRPTST